MTCEERFYRDLYLRIGGDASLDEDIIISLGKEYYFIVCEMGIWEWREKLLLSKFVHPPLWPFERECREYDEAVMLDILSKG